MRFGKWFILLCLAVGLSACSQGDKQAASDEEPKVLTAKLAAPESAAKNEKAVMPETGGIGNNVFGILSAALAAFGVALLRPGV